MADETEPQKASTPSVASQSILLAVARERLAEAHYENALDFIRRTAAELDAPRAFDIYARLHHLSEEEDRTLKNRVIASFGVPSETNAPTAPATFVAITGDVEWDVTASFFYRIRKRLGGRKNMRLRRWVELHMGHVETKLIRIHVENVLRLVEVATGEETVGEVVKAYLSALGARDSLYEAIAIATLDHLYSNAVERPALEIQPHAVEQTPQHLRVVGKS